MTSENVTFTGDASSLVAAANRGKKAIQDQENAIRKTGAAAKGLGDQLTQTFTGMAKGALITGAIAKALEAAAESAERIRKAGATSAETRGGEAVSVERALVASGARLTADQRQSILGMVGEGTTTASETTGFIEAFAKQRGRRGTFADITRATQAYQSGAYTQDELLSMRRLPTLQEQNARLASMSPEARAELEQRGRMRSAEAEVRAAVAPNQAARMVEGERERRRLTNPAAQATMDALSSLPLGFGGLFAAGEADIIEKQQGRTIRLADDQIKRMAPTPRPAVIEGKRE